MSNDIGYDLLNNMPHGFNPQDVEEIAVISMDSPFGEIHFVQVTMKGEIYAVAESIGLDPLFAHITAMMLVSKLKELIDGSN